MRPGAAFKHPPNSTMVSDNIGKPAAILLNFSVSRKSFMTHVAVGMPETSLDRVPLRGLPCPQHSSPLDSRCCRRIFGEEFPSCCNLELIKTTPA